MDDFWHVYFLFQVIDSTQPVVESCIPPQPVVSELHAKVDVLLPEFSDNSQIQFVVRSSNQSDLIITTSRLFSHSWKYGVTAVSVTASDSSNNNITCTFNVTVLGE